MYVIDAVLSAAGPEVTVSVETLDDVISWFAEHRPMFGYWDVEVIDPEGNTVPEKHYC